MTHSDILDSINPEKTSIHKFQDEDVSDSISSNLPLDPSHNSQIYSPSSTTNLHTPSAFNDAVTIYGISC